MNILTNVQWTSPTGGVEMNAFQISRELVQRGHQIDLLYLEPGELIPEYERFCRSVTHVKTLEYYFRRSPVGLARQVASQIPTAWAAVGCHPEIVYANQISSIGWSVPAKTYLRAPLVCQIHSMTEVRRASTSRLAKRIDRLVVVSNFVADEVLRCGFDPERLAVVHNGVDPADYPVGGEAERLQARRKLDISDDAFVVTFVGRLDPDKGLHVLLDAWQKLGFGPDEARLVVVGSSVLEGTGSDYARQQVSRADESVLFLPARRDVVTPLHAANAVVVPSVVDESFGRVVVEALATGRPAIASAVGGIPEILHGDLSRWLFDQGDAAALADRLRDVMGWEGTDPELGHRCTARAVEEFSLARTADGLERVFAELL
jgi:glycosyltransferase involved in cell wall biosynthesis